MPNCAIKNCKNTTSASKRVNGDVSFHRFPNEPNLKEKWIEATGNKDWFPTKYSTICSIHFDEASFIEGKKRRLLTDTAYPTIDILKTTTNEDINEPSTLSENTPKNNNMLNKLNLAQQKIKKQKKEIKRLKEQNRRKVKKIVALTTSLEGLKKNLLLLMSKVVLSEQAMQELKNLILDS